MYEIALKLKKIPIRNGASINSVEDAIAYLKKKLADLPYEQVGYILLKQELVDSLIITSKGSKDSAPSNHTDMIKAALLTNSTGVIMFHNHPSASETPSGADVNVAKKVKEALALFDLALVDSIIIPVGGETVTSLRKLGFI